MFFRRKPTVERIVERIIKIGKELRDAGQPSKMRELARDAAGLIRDVTYDQREEIWSSVNLEYFNESIAYYQRQVDDAYRRLHNELSKMRKLKEQGQPIPDSIVGLVKELELELDEEYALLHLHKSRQLLIRRIVKMGRTPDQAVKESIRHTQLSQAHFMKLRHQWGMYKELSREWGSADELLDKYGSLDYESPPVTESSAEATEEQSEADRLLEKYKEEG